MTEPSIRQSSPFSTGGGGTNFETRVQAAFTIPMLTGGVAPCLPPYPITKLKLQGRYAGFNTDDFIVFSKQPKTDEEAKLLVQIKHDISFTEGGEIFAEVIQSAWNDFNDESFDASSDSIALITGPLSATDINDVRPVLEWARYAENEEEFFTKLNTVDFSSDAKRKKLEAFKTHLKAANNGTNVSDRQLWEFLKAFHLIGYDLDTESGGTLSLLYSLIARYSSEAAPLLWARVVDVVQTANQNAGTLTLETLPEDIRTAFSAVKSSGWAADVNKLKEHGNYILGGIRTTVGGVHIKQADAFTQLLDMSEASNFVFVTGGRGFGKSGLIRNFSDYVSEHSPIFCLRAEDLDKSHLDNVFSAMGLKGSLGDLETGFALIPKKYLIIESLEKLLELEHQESFTDLLQFLNRQRGWTVIATGRDYAFQPIAFHYLQPSGIDFKPLVLDGFSDEQVQSLCEQLDPLQKFANNPTLKTLLRSPFLADLAYRTLQTGTEFTPEDGEREFKAAVWRDVIAKEQARAHGMPSRRKKAFIDIAVKRTKRMVYGVPETEFDSGAVLKLEEDDLVHRNSTNSMVRPAHDVLEDWALEQFIEDAYLKYSDNTQKLLDAIGHEPAISRAFRLWLYQKLRFGENVSDFVLSVLNNQDIQRHWQDETITAILQGDNPVEFLELLQEQLFLDNGKLLKRFCFILRIACQTPYKAVISGVERDHGTTLTDTLFLKPYGQGWEAIIHFLFENKESLSKTLVPHVTAVLHDWSSLLRLDEEFPVSTREAGLLALHLLDDLKESFRDNDDRKKLISVIIRSISVIHEEFIELLERDVFVARTGSRQHRPHYVGDFCEMAFSGIESAFLCKHDPDMLIKLAHFEWLVEESDEDEEPWYRSPIGVAGCFSLHEHKYEFFPASGAKGPFQYLLRLHPRKGLDFILELLNITAEKYAHSDLDSPQRHSSTQQMPEPVIEPLTIQLNDGTAVQQYHSGRLWLAYRGHSVVPYLLQSALMALENWLIAAVEYSGSDELAWLFDYILRNSNSVMPTAVLASVATGFPAKIGKSALPLLRTPELYFMDLERLVHEMGGGEANWFGLSRDPLAELYTQERRTAALRPWRKEHLETLVVKLQFSEWRDEALAAIDMLRASAPNTETMRFLYHRIDSRGWKAIEGPEENTLTFEPKNLEADLEEIQQNTQEEKLLFARFSALYVWAKKAFKREPLESDHYTTWCKALAEAKALFEKLKAGAQRDLAAMYCGGIVTAAAVFVREHFDDLGEQDIRWCTELIAQTVTANADTDDSLAIVDKTDHDGAAAAAAVLPVLLDFAADDDERLAIKSLIAIALTHVNEAVRHGAANGIREHLWQRDPEFAQECIMGVIKYARFERDNQLERRRLYFAEDDTKEVEIARLQAQKDEFREQFVRGKLSSDLNPITLQTHSPWHILTPCFMIPYGSTKPEHVALLSQMLALFFEAEQGRNRNNSDGDNDLEIHYEIPLNFTRRFAKYLFHLHESGFEDYIEQLRVGCDIAPSFMDNLVMYIAVEAEALNAQEVYWQLWKELSQKVQEVAIELAQYDSDYRQRDDRRRLIRGMLKADIDWQKIDFENQDIALGKELILEFVTNAGKNPDVFEALAKLMYYFPSIFFKSGIHLLSKHQKEEGGTRLFSGVNTSFYLERSIQRFLQRDQVGPLLRHMHESCLILLDALVETASSRAYYLREHLIHSRRTLLNPISNRSGESPSL